MTFDENDTPKKEPSLRETLKSIKSDVSAIPWIIMVLVFVQFNSCTMQLTSSPTSEIRSLNYELRAIKRELESLHTTMRYKK